MDYRESEVDDDLAYKYYKKKLGVNEPTSDHELDDEEDYNKPFVNIYLVMLQDDTGRDNDKDSQDDYSGPKERIIGLGDTEESDDEPKYPQVRNDQLDNYKTLTESEESDHENNMKFNIVKGSSNGGSEEFVKPSTNKKPRPTFGVVDVCFTLIYIQDDNEDQIVVQKAPQQFAGFNAKNCN